MRSPWRSALLIGLVLLAPTGTATASVVGLPAWDVATSPNSGTVANELLGVEAISSNDVWAVGRRGTLTLTMRWNGSTFSIVRSPNVRNRANVLEDVDGTGSSDVWAVGHEDSITFGDRKTLILRWDGSRWRRIPSPSPGSETDQSILTGVAAISPTDAWAVGTFRTTDPADAASLTLHWNGTAWTSFPNNCGTSLREVFALSATNVWAVGGSSTCRWNGTTWTSIPAAPPIGQGFLDLQDVTGTAANNLWAVGLIASSCGEGVCFSGAIERWNGTAWTFTGRPEVLYGVHAFAANDVYAVGSAIGPAVLHFDGSAWSDVPQPSPSIPGRLFAVDASSASNWWAVGWRLDSGMARTLVERAPSPNSGAVVGETGVAFATVSWFGPESSSVETDPSGQYQAGGLTAGTYTFTATNAGCTPASTQVTVPAGTTISVALPISC
jgi:Carboxypeptidase regulatory-like domain